MRVGQRWFAGTIERFGVPTVRQRADIQTDHPDSITRRVSQLSKACAEPPAGRFQFIRDRPLFLIEERGFPGVSIDLPPRRKSPFPTAAEMAG